MRKQEAISFSLILVIATLFIITSPASAGSMSSSNYQTDAVISSGAGSSSSPYYSTEAVADVITGSSGSLSYNQTSFLFVPPPASPSGQTNQTTSPVPSVHQQAPAATLPSVPDFSISPSFILLEIKQGENGKSSVEITNNENATITINISTEGLQNLIFPEESSITIQPYGTKNLTFDFYSFNNTSPDVYLGQIVFSLGGYRKSAGIALEVIAKQPLFDILTSVLTKTVQPGGTVNANVTVINKGDIEKIDVKILAEIKDFSNNTYASKVNTYAVTNDTTREISLNLPSNIQPGNYILYSKVMYGNITASGYDTFYVTKPATLSVYGISQKISAFLSEASSKMMGITKNLISSIKMLPMPRYLMLVITFGIPIILFLVRVIIKAVKKRRLSFMYLYTH